MKPKPLCRKATRVSSSKTQGSGNTLFVNWNLASSHRLSRSPDVTRTENRGVNTGHQKGRVFEGFFLLRVACRNAGSPFFFRMAFQSKAIGLVVDPSSRPRKTALRSRP